uniref:CSON014566 protein n=1 Tax=Culicoides sonorensis TaxID=179676 RepID=A0A336MFA2_CULSO
MKILIVILSLAGLAFANPDLKHLCVGVPDNTIKVNPYNCNAYVTCLGGHAFEQFCQEGLYFNEGIQQCDHPENVNCNPSGGNPNPSYPESQPHPACVAAGPNSNLLLKHELDCTKFYMCNGVNAVLMTCPNDLHFNDNTKACDYANVAGCQ